MTKSELRILHWLSGTTKESYWDNDFKEMREGIDTTSERLSNAAVALHDKGFPLRIRSAWKYNTFIITRADVTSKTKLLAYTATN